jgi:hypothetical protein
MRERARERSRGLMRRTRRFEERYGKRGFYIYEYF